MSLYSSHEKLNWFNIDEIKTIETFIKDQFFLSYSHKLTLV